MLERELERPLGAAREPLLIDLGNCEFIKASTGIALIVRSWQALDGDGDGSGSRCSARSGGRSSGCSTSPASRRRSPTHQSRREQALDAAAIPELAPRSGSLRCRGAAPADRRRHRRCRGADRDPRRREAAARLRLSLSGGQELVHHRADGRSNRRLPARSRQRRGDLPAERCRPGRSRHRPRRRQGRSPREAAGAADRLPRRRLGQADRQRRGRTPVIHRARRATAASATAATTSASPPQSTPIPSAGPGNDYCKTSDGSDGCWGGPGRRLLLNRRRPGRLPRRCRQNVPLRRPGADQLYGGESSRVAAMSEGAAGKRADALRAAPPGNPWIALIVSSGASQRTLWPLGTVTVGSAGRREHRDSRIPAWQGRRAAPRDGRPRSAAARSAELDGPSRSKRRRPRSG